MNTFLFRQTRYVVSFQFNRTSTQPGHSGVYCSTGMLIIYVGSIYQLKSSNANKQPCKKYLQSFCDFHVFQWGLSAHAQWLEQIQRNNQCKLNPLKKCLYSSYQTPVMTVCHAPKSIFVIFPLILRPFRSQASVYIAETIFVHLNDIDCSDLTLFSVFFFQFMNRRLNL